MDMYIGIDAHSASCTARVIVPTGKRISSQVYETKGRSLLTVVRAVPGTRISSSRKAIWRPSASVLVQR